MSAPAPLSRLRDVAPGLGLALLIALVATWLAPRLGALVLAAQGIAPEGRGSPVSAIPVAILLGLAVAHLVRVPASTTAGLELATKAILRGGIVLVGLKLSFSDVMRVGAFGVPVVVGLVGLALVVTVLIARKFGVADTLGTLAAASTAVCGITATLAVAPAVRADARETAYTVANVTVLGLVAMLTYPYLAHALLGDTPAAAGLFLGTAIHDTSQVMGAALAYREVFGDARALEVATVAKLTRNALIVVVVPALGWWTARRHGGGGRNLAPFPLFVLGFVALSIVRSAGDAGLESGGPALGLFGADAWHAAIHTLGDEASVVALATALAAVGLSTRFETLRSLGTRPLLVGIAAALTVGLTSLVTAKLLAPYLAG